MKKVSWNIENILAFCPKWTDILLKPVNNCVLIKLISMWIPKILREQLLYAFEYWSLSVINQYASKHSRVTEKKTQRIHAFVECKAKMAHSLMIFFSHRKLSSCLLAFSRSCSLFCPGYLLPSPAEYPTAQLQCTCTNHWPEYWVRCVWPLFQEQNAWDCKIR